MFGRRAVRLGFDHNLMRGIDHRDPAVALDHALVDGHLRALVIGAIALYRGPRHTAANFGVLA